MACGAGRFRQGARSVEFGKVDRVGAGIAGAAVQGVVDHQGFGVTGVLDEIEYVRAGVHMVLADGPAAEPAGPDGGPFAVPAVHQ